MGRYQFMEYAVGHPSNRKELSETKKVIQMPFRKENRFKEYWRSMYLYDTKNPTEESPMFGNFYIESDEEDFNKNKEMIVDITEYLNKEYHIPFEYFDFFMTNRSLWLSIPTKVFGCFGSAKLNLIHKKMAKDIQNELNTPNLDLSIYKWNGLIHSLGSYLTKTKSWVTKFTYYDLENATNREDLKNVKYDNFWGLEDIEVVPKAKQWFNNAKKKVFGYKKITQKESLSQEYLCMKKLEEKGYIEENRNLHIYTYALYLKQLGLSVQEGIDRIKSTFSNRYVHLKECERTIKSAFQGNKKFSLIRAKQLLAADLFTEQEEMYTTTFIVPRSFITLLHENKAHYNCYKILLKTLACHQKEKKSYSLSLKGEKYKKDIISNFQKLEELGLIKYCLTGDRVESSITLKDRNTYKNHIVLPYSFVESKLFNTIKKEIRVFLELVRSSYRCDNGIVFTNIKVTTLEKNLRTTKKTLLKELKILKKMKLYFGKKLFFSINSKEYKQVVKNMVEKIKSKTKSITISLKKKIENDIVNIKELLDTTRSLFNHKMFYSRS